MANYCTVTDVQVLLGYITAFSATTKPTLTQVTQEIENVTNEIDFYLNGAGISSQPTDSRILGRLKMACSYGVACRIGMAAKGGADVSGSQPEFYCTTYQAVVSEIKDNPELYGNIAGTETTCVSNQVLDGTYTENEMKALIIDDTYRY